MRRSSDAVLSRRVFGGVVAGFGFALSVPTASAQSNGNKGPVGQIRGKVTGHQNLTNPVWLESRDPGSHSYSFREPSPTVSASMRRLFPYIPFEICLVALASGDKGKLPDRVVRVAGGRTSAMTLVVPPGTAIKFRNGDPIAHRLFGVNIPTFGASDMRPGAERVWTVPGPGVFEIRDELVPSVRMWVIGEPKVASVAFPNLDGAFGLEVAEAGEYTVQAYFAGQKVGNPLPAAVGNLTQGVNLIGTPIVLAGAKKDAE
jgi:hypothetical protein